MKNPRLLFYLFVVPIFSILFSCAPKYGAHFQQSRYDSHEYTEKTKEDKLQETEKLFVSAEAETTIEEQFIKEKDIELVDKLTRLNKRAEAVDNKSQNKSIEKEKQQLIVDAIKTRMNEMTREEKREFRKEVKQFAKEQKLKKTDNINSIQSVSDVNESTALMVIITILLPPLGVFLHEEEINNRFWISLLLTLLFYIPGLVYSLIVVLE